VAETKKARRLRWARALESGEFRQGKHALMSDDHYCCLGVACELMVRDGLLKRATDSIGVVRYTSVTDPTDSDASELPLAAQDYYGLSESNAPINLDDVPVGAISRDPFVDRRVRHANSLVDLNDESDATFATIARVIRLEPEGMVKR
jgi:hypothetical protein